MANKIGLCTSHDYHCISLSPSLLSSSAHAPNLSESKLVDGRDKSKNTTRGARAYCVNQKFMFKGGKGEIFSPQQIWLFSTLIYKVNAQRNIYIYEYIGGTWATPATSFFGELRAELIINAASLTVCRINGSLQREKERERGSWRISATTWHNNNAYRGSLSAQCDGDPDLSLSLVNLRRVFYNLRAIY